MTIDDEPEAGGPCPREPTNQSESAVPRPEWPGNMPIAVSVNEFCRLTNLGRTKAYEIIGANQVAVRRIGRRTLVLTKSIIAFMEGDAEAGTGR